MSDEFLGRFPVFVDLDQEPGRRILEFPLQSVNVGMDRFQFEEMGQMAKPTADAPVLETAC